MFINEDNKIELKEIINNTLPKEIVAFLNTDGGTIYILDGMKKVDIDKKKVDIEKTKISKTIRKTNEIDFYAIRDNRLYYIQVANNTNDAETKARE